MEVTVVIKDEALALIEELSELYQMIKALQGGNLMTGTGTQSDPFVPVTLTEFIEAVGTSGAYVVLDRDIDASEDPNYGGELTAPIGFAATRVGGNGHFVRGVTARAQYMIQKATESAACSVYDLFFKDWGHKKTTSNSASIMGHVRGWIGFYDCTFSVSAACHGFDTRLTEYVHAERCAIHIKTLGGTTNGMDLVESNFVETTAIVDGNCGGYNMILTRSALIVQRASIDAGFLNSSASYSYIAYTDTDPALTSVNINLRSAAGCLFCCDDDAVTASLPSGMTRATLAQLKDEAWLASVGFLP